jgi:uncharacterized membrane protein
MTRFEYIDALRQALSDLPPDVIAATVAEYERRIRDASAAGQSEDDIIENLGDPQKVAAERRANMPFKTFPKEDNIPVKAPANFARVFFSFVGLMIFNLFLLVPAMVYSALLFASYVIAIACYAGGIMVTAASLAGVNEISLDPPYEAVSFHQMHVDAKSDDNNGQAIVDIKKDAKLAATPPAAASASASASASAASSASTAPSATAVARTGSSADGKALVTIEPNGVRITDGSSKIRITDDGDDFIDDRNLHLDIPGIHIHHPESGRNVFFGPDDFNASRPLRTSIGIGLILAGILAFLLCLVVSRYTFVGISRLVQMEFAVLKNA